MSSPADRTEPRARPFEADGRGEGGSGARVLVVGGGRFARHLTERLISLDATVEVVRLQRSGAGTPSTRLRVLINGTYPADWIAEQVSVGRYDVVVVASSAVSPYVHDNSTGWGRLRSRLPFGLLAPLQTKILFPVARAMKQLGSSRPRLVNACYPEVANQLAGIHAQAPDWGLGNGQALASYLSRQQGQQVVAVAHHWHLHAPADEADEMLAWNAAGQAQTRLRERLAPLRMRSQQDRNRYAAHTAAEQLWLALQGVSVLTSVTAPAGLAGTIPCLLHGFEVEELTERYTAPLPVRTRLEAWTRREGLTVDRAKGEVEFVGELRGFYRNLFGASTFRIAEWPELTAQLERLVTRDVEALPPLKPIEV